MTRAPPPFCNRFVLATERGKLFQGICHSDKSPSVIWSCAKLRYFTLHLNAHTHSHTHTTQAHTARHALKQTHTHTHTHSYPHTMAYPHVLPICIHTRVSVSFLFLITQAAISLQPLLFAIFRCSSRAPSAVPSHAPSSLR